MKVKPERYQLRFLTKFEVKLTTLRIDITVIYHLALVAK